MLLKSGMSLWVCAVLVPCALDENHEHMHVEVCQQEQNSFTAKPSFLNTHNHLL